MACFIFLPVGDTMRIRVLVDVSVFEDLGGDVA
jgi:hypothetical protein